MAGLTSCGPPVGRLLLFSLRESGWGHKGAPCWRLRGQVGGLWLSPAEAGGWCPSSSGVGVGPPIPHSSSFRSGGDQPAVPWGGENGPNLSEGHSVSDLEAFVTRLP